MVFEGHDEGVLCCVKLWNVSDKLQISYGGYKLGANSANILVQDRLTGLINEERMSVYVRLGIRLLYKGLKSRDMETKRSMSCSLSWSSIADSYSPQTPSFIIHQARPEVR